MLKTAGALDGIKNWFSNKDNLKDLAIGAGTGLGAGALTYGLTGLTGMSRKARILSALGVGAAAGGTAGYFGKDIRGLFGKKPLSEQERARLAYASSLRDVEDLYNKGIDYAATIKDPEERAKYIGELNGLKQQGAESLKANVLRSPIITRSTASTMG